MPPLINEVGMQEFTEIIYATSSDLTLDLLFDFGVIGPLLLLSLASAVAVYINYRLENPRG